MKKILLVDDEESIHHLYCEELEEEGYKVNSFFTGGHALQKIKIESPDLVILDINMPRMNGIDVLRKIKDINPELPVIISTAYNEFKQDISAWASDDFIVKSVNIDELKNAVRQILSE